MELEVRNHEPAAAGPNSGHRGKSWHRCCVLPTQCLHGSLRGWWSRIRCLSCAGNELCPLHPSVKCLSTEGVFAVGEMPPDMSGRCFFNPSRCSNGGKGTDSVSAMQAGQRAVSSSLLQLFSSAQGCRDKKPLEVSVRHCCQAPRHPHNPVCCVGIKRSLQSFIRHLGAQG